MKHHHHDHHPDHEVREHGGRLWKILYGNVFVLGILSLVWLIWRSGRKPSRLQYPCQKAALANVGLLFGAASVPLAARLPGVFTRGRLSPRAKRVVKGLEVAGMLALAALVAVSLAGLASGGGGRSRADMKAAAAGLSLPALQSASGAGAPGTSDIFMSENIPSASAKGVDNLIDVMDGNGLDFFKTAGAGKAAGPQGIIGSNDVVVIKVNGEWQDRGGTNTDVVKGLVDAITHHPDGFTGEIVICDNGHWASFMDNLPNNRNPDRCNAEDHTQSFNDVAVMYAGGHRVSVYDWAQIQTTVVADYGEGDARDGYVYVPSAQIGYPKFTTVNGTHISLRNGVYSNGTYDNSRLKLINVPVLKDHGGLGMTASIKHFMGVQDRYQNTENPPHAPMRTSGFMGTVMLTSHYPDLNIVDAIWITPSGGPNAPYGNAVRTNRLLASRDPVALDYYCGKYVMEPVSGDVRHDPNNMDGANNAFHQMLFSTKDVLAAAGKQVTTDESRMNVYKSATPQPPPVTKYQSFLAEGCTGSGFETWVLVANPNTKPAKVYISYMTENGCRNKDPVTLPAQSRLTVNANADIWSANAGVRVGSDLPVYAERAMYWRDRAEGHDSIGAGSGATNWYLADGCTGFGFETWVSVLNTTANTATAHVNYLTANGPVGGPTIAIPPWSRQTVNMAGTVTDADAAVQVTSDQPVVVERSMYQNGRRGGSNSIGVTAARSDWYFAEGATHSNFETYVLLLNPQTREATATLELMTPTGKVTTARVLVPAGARRTVNLAAYAPDSDVSTHVHSDVALVAERSMLWPVAGGRASHASIGMAAPATDLFMPEGCTGWGFETWLMLQNPGGSAATVSVYGMTEGGERKLTHVTLPARTRTQLKLNDYYTGNLSIRVHSSKPVVGERSIYWNDRSGGTNSIGY